MEDLINRLAAAIGDSGEGCSSGAVYVDPHKAAQAALDELRAPLTAMLRLAILKPPMTANTTAEGYWNALVSVTRKDEDDE